MTHRHRFEPWRGEGCMEPNCPDDKPKPDRMDLVILVTRTDEDGEMYCTPVREQTRP